MLERTVINEKLARNTWRVKKAAVISRESKSGPKTSGGNLVC